MGHEYEIGLHIQNTEVRICKKIKISSNFSDIFLKKICLLKYFSESGEPGAVLGCVTLAGAYNCMAATLSSFIAPPGPKSTHYFTKFQPFPKTPPRETKEFKEPEDSTFSSFLRLHRSRRGLKHEMGL